MTGKTWLAVPTILALIVLGTLIVLWALTAGATHIGPATGDLATDPMIISPDNSVATADRTITITLTDPNLNKPLFVGTGPNGEPPDPTVSGKGVVVGDPTSITTGGERVLVGTDVFSTFTVALTANPISDGFTPLADRDDDGDIDINDVEIVLVDGGGLVAADIAVSGIFNAARGQVTFTVFKVGLASAGAFFDVRYATSGVELTRDIEPFAEAVTAPIGGLVHGQQFTLTLDIGNLPLQDTNGDGALSTADINVTIAGRTAANTPIVTSIGGTAILANPANGLASADQLTLVHSGDALAGGTEISVSYLGLVDLVTVKGDLGVDMPLRMRETGPDTGVFQATVIAIGSSFLDQPNRTTSIPPQLEMPIAPAWRCSMED